MRGFGGADGRNGIKVGRKHFCFFCTVISFTWCFLQSFFYEQNLAFNWSCM